MFLITHVKCCPALMVPVASCDPGTICAQFPEKETIKPATGTSLTVKEPGPNVTVSLCASLIENDDGEGLLPIICTLKVLKHLPPLSLIQSLLTNRVPVVSGFPAVFGTPLLTLFAAL